MKKKKLDKENFRKKKVFTASIGQCVHVAGVFNFMNIAEELGYNCKFLGPAIQIKELISRIKKREPNILGLSYRLTPQTVDQLLQEFFEKYKDLEIKPHKLFFAGTPEVVKIARKFDQFDHFFIGGESKFEILNILKFKEDSSKSMKEVPMDLISRIKWKKPYPVIRAHFGLQNLKDTIKGIRKIAEANVLDIISIAPDQNTQAYYFHPEKRDETYSGAGGVPLRSREDFIKLHHARLRGNHPLLRIYAGTQDFIKLAKLYRNTIRNAWGAIPIFWFNEMDGRGPLPLGEAIRQHLEAIHWHGKNEIPVEINDSHHWSLRNAPDAVAVADMYLSGIIAKKLGVKHFIAQYMFNTPPSVSFEMDLAKMLAKTELLQTLNDDSFSIIKQVRTGLASFPLDLDRAKGQLAAATMVQMALKPDIIHVVSYSEARHAAKAEGVIESCRIVDQVVNQMFNSEMNFLDDRVRKRKKELIEQAKWIINLIPRLAKSKDERKHPYTSPTVLNRLVKYGIFDAPHLKNNKFARGKIQTKISNGACYSWDPTKERILDERKRIKNLVKIDSSHLQELTGKKFEGLVIGK
ncbi:MAG: methionine synthase [Promethearchaeia archaeon]